MPKKSNTSNTKSSKNATKKGSGSTTSGQSQSTQQVQSLNIVGQYTKDISFKTPGRPAGMNPYVNLPQEVNVNIQLKSNKTDKENVYEVELQLTATSSSKDKKLFEVDVTYAGVFALNGIESKNIGPVLMVECPRILFPYVSTVVSNITREAGFQPLSIAPIDFAAQYVAQLKQAQSKQAAPGNKG